MLHTETQSSIPPQYERFSDSDSDSESETLWGIPSSSHEALDKLLTQTVSSLSSGSNPRSTRYTRMPKQDETGTGP